MARTSATATAYIDAAMNAIAREMHARDLLAGLYRRPMQDAVGDLIFTQGAIDTAEITIDRIQVLIRDLKMDADKSSTFKGEIDKLDQQIRDARAGCRHALCHVKHANHGLRSVVIRLHEAIERERRLCAATSSCGSYERAEALVYA